MDTMPGNVPMENPPHTPLDGLDPADLLKQGVAEDTFVDDAPSAFNPPAIEELAVIFPQFEILELIGKGGMGAVYKVHQKDLDRIVALKILPPAIGQSPEFSNRFTREAKALARLNHPGIVTLHEFGQQEGLYFILMEFVDGVNLAQLMKTGRISPREALAIVPQICDALQYAHDQGIVHRDIKPENLLLDRSGRVKVADFGIAKVVAAVCDPIRCRDTPVPTDQTIAGKIIGTPAYMAPEQISHPAEVDHRADIYALGVVFYQMLTGELPGKRLEAPSKKVHIDGRLDEIVLRAMEKDPELRYQQASVMRTRVETLGENAMPPKTTAENPPSSVKKTRSIGTMIAIACGVMLLLHIIIMASIWFFGFRSSRIQQAEESKQVRYYISKRHSFAPEKQNITRVTGNIVLPKEFSEGQKERIVKAALALLAICEFSEEISGTKMFNAGNGIAHIQIMFPDVMAGNHPDDMLITFPLTSGSVWTRRGNKYERHSKFTPAAAETLSAALGHAPSVAFAEATGLPEKEAAATAKTWLAGIDAGNYAQSWKDAAKYFQTAITEAAWREALSKVRKPLGEMKSRKMLDAKSAKSLPGAPDGEYVVMRFDTSFAAKEKAVETVTFLKETVGTWKAAGYFIK